MRAYRSPLRLFVLGMIGVALILAAVDVMFGHWLSTPPEANDGVLSTRGLAQQRGDIVWGAAMVGVGTLLVGGAVVELVRRQPVAQVSQEGLIVAIGPHESAVEIPWDVVESIRTDVELDPYDGSQRDQFVIEMRDRSDVPDNPVGATWRGDELRVDAGDWSRSTTDMALSAQGALGHHRRVAEITEMGPPSVTWDMTASAGDEEAAEGQRAEQVAAAPRAVGVDDSHDDADDPPDDAGGEVTA